MKFTPAQQICVDLRNRDLIVSAGAGAGKTTTLLERIYALLTDPKDPCNLDEMLIVTFTREAAHKMKAGMAERLRQATLDQNATEALRQHASDQLAILPRAQISTIHSFCLTVISAYPDEVNLAPGFDMMSEEEARLFRREFFREKIEAALLDTNSETGTLLRGLLREFDPIRGIDMLIQYLIRFQGFLDSLPYPEQFVERCEQLLLPEEPFDLIENSQRGAIARAHVKRVLETLYEELLALKSFNRGSLHPKLHEQWDYAVNLHYQIKSLLQAPFASAELDSVLGDLKFPRMAGGKTDYSEYDELFRVARTRAKDIFKKEYPRILPFYGNNFATDYFTSNPILLVLLNEIGLSWNGELFKRHLENRRLTFSHLERLALQILHDRETGPTEIARVYQQQFRHVLIDEFQDVNELQDLIIRSITRKPSPQQPGNLFCVGDVKQSIYEFRQADPTLFLRAYNSSSALDSGEPEWKSARHSLRENFRSSPSLLGEFNALFRHLLLRDTVGMDYSPHHEFIAGLKEDHKDIRPAFQLDILPKDHEEITDNEEEGSEDVSLEAKHVAKLIASIGPPWRNIAILLRSTVGTASDLIEALESQGIPSFSDSRLGFLTAVEVVEFRSLLQTIYNPYNDIALLATLRGPAVRMNEEELLRLRMVDRRAPFYDNLRGIAESGEGDIHRKANSFLQKLDRWQRLSVSHSMSTFFGMLFDELHLLESAAVRPGGDQRRLNLLQMLDRAEQFDSFLVKGLGSFLDFMQDLIDNEEDFAPPSPLPKDADVVRIMSVHKSKGLEFPIVVCPFFGRKFNEADIRQPFLYDRTIGMATKLRAGNVEKGFNPPLFEALRSSRQEKSRSEELRLLYVALTRAERALYITASDKTPVESLLKSMDTARRSGGRLRAAEILRANRPLDWIYATLPRRFTSFQEESWGLRASDGIAGASVIAEYNDFENKNRFAPRGTAQGETQEEKPSAKVLKEFRKAAQRIAELQARPEPPQVRAKISVTEAKRAFDATRDLETPPLRLEIPRHEDEGTLEWMPAPADKEGQPRGAVRGRAMHRFLALCDLVGLSRGECRLRDELERMKKEALLTGEEAELVNLYAVQWFLNSELGRAVRTAKGRLYRERPFTIRLDRKDIPAIPEGDSVILQGVVDLLFEQKDGWTLIDYKTDFCGKEGERVQELVSAYTPQMQLYRVAVERSLGVKIAQEWLVFLNGRTSERIDSAPDIATAWKRVAEAGALIFSDPERQIRSVNQV